VLDLDNLPGLECACNFSPQEVCEMLQTCRDRIFMMEASRIPRSVTPSKQASAGEPKSVSKTLKPAQIAREKKSIVKDIKKLITPVKFHYGFDRVEREIKFSADRLPPEAAEQLLLQPQQSWSSATVSVTLGENDAIQALSLSSGELVGAVWRKGGAMRGGRFGSVKAQRLGSAPLTVKSLTLNYTIKSQRLVGKLICINDNSLKRGREDFDSGDEDFGVDDGFCWGFGF
jgi:hypothetical protein